MVLLNPYCEVAEVLEELRGKERSSAEPNGIDNAVLEAAINSASRFIDRYKGRDYFLHDHRAIPEDEEDRTTEEGPLVLRGGMMDGLIHDNRFLILPFSPIIELTSITAGETVWVQDTDFALDPNGFRLISLNQNWPLRCYSETVQFVGKFGYDQENHEDVPTGLPADVRRACILIAAAATGHNQKEVVGVDGAKSSVIDKNIPKVAFDFLGSRRILV